VNTLGDHLQKRRLDLGLQWKEVAEETGTHATNVANWWKGRTRPGLRLWPGVIRFLSYDPRPRDESLGAQLRRRRETHGWSRAEVATHLGVSGSVLWRWESGQRQPKGAYLARVYAFLGDDPRPGPVVIGERLKRHRERLGFTLRAMAARLGVVQSTLCRWEAGERQPRGEYLRRVEQELNAGTMPTSSSDELVWYRHDV
jgi:transcriptional regulator with XRE-family HTH domain